MSGIAGCIGGDTGNPPVRTGESLLEFGQGIPAFEEPPIYLQYYLGSPFFHWGIREDALESSVAVNAPGARTTQAPFDLRAEALRATFNFAQYRSYHAFWRQIGGRNTLRDIATQHEIILFARDPEELFRALADAQTRAIPNQSFPKSMNAFFREQLVPSYLPRSASLMYPPQHDWNTQPPTLNNVNQPVPIRAYFDTSSFWDQGIVPAGTGAAPNDPDGPGSVKAVRVINHGLCAKFAPFNDVLDGNGNIVTAGLFKKIPKAFFSAVEETVAARAKATSPSADLLLDTSNVTAFLHQTDDREATPHGGFFFNFAFKERNIPVGTFRPDVSVEANVAYEFKLLDGRLTVEPMREYGNGKGDFFIGALEDAIAASLRVELEGILLTSLTKAPGLYDVPDTLPGRLFNEADAIQEWPGFTAGDGEGCAARADGDELIEEVPSPETLGGTCSGMFAGIKGALDRSIVTAPRIAGSLLQIPQSALVVSQLWSTVVETKVDPKNPAKRVYKNVRCAPRNTAGDRFCRYVVPARRVNPLPDGVELVLADDDREYTNPAFVLYVIALNEGRLADVCDPPRTQALGTLYPRTFATYPYDNKRYTATCVKIPFGGGAYKCSAVEQ